MSEVPGGPPGPGPATPGPVARPPVRRLRNGSGTAALVMGVLSLTLAVLVIYAPLGAFLGVVGAVFGIIGLTRVNNGLADNRGHAIGGLVTSLAGLLIGILITITISGFLATHWNDLRTFARCLDSASGKQARDACAQQFSDKVD